MAHRRDRISMVHNVTGPVKGIPKNLLSYKEIPWNDLDPLAAAILAAGAKNSAAENLFFVAAKLARIAKHKRLVTKVLDLWLADNKDLDQYLVSAINSGFALVYKDPKSVTSHVTGPTRPAGVTEQQYRVLEALKSFEEEYQKPFGVSLSQLSKRTGIQKRSLLRIVNSLQTKKLIEICQLGGSNRGERRSCNVYRILSTNDDW